MNLPYLSLLHNTHPSLFTLLTIALGYFGALTLIVSLMLWAVNLAAGELMGEAFTSPET